MIFTRRATISLARILTSLLVIGLGVVTNIAPSNAAIVLTITESDPSLVFLKANSVTISGSGGTAQGDVVLYKNVGTYGGVSVDAVITTVSLTGSISNYDNPGSATSATGSANYWMINTVGGDARFRFEFYKGGSYTGAGSGIPVVLQNVKVTSIDIDTSGTGANQYSDFTGFQKYAMMSPTNLAVIAQPTVPNEPNRIRFIANLAGSRSSVPQDQVLVKYDAVQKMEIAFGNIKAGSTNYFGLIFGPWPGSGIPVEYTNQFNTPPVSSNVTLGVSDSRSAPSVLPLTAFGNYSDADSNPFNQIKIASVPASGAIQKFNGSSWVDLAPSDLVSVSDIESGKVRYYPAAPAADTSFTFYVHDGLEFSTNAYTLTLQVKANTQEITFNNPGSKAPSQTFASGATTTATGETVTLTSNTPGVCTVNNSTGAITTIASGTCSITATQPGNSTYPAATPVTREFLVSAKTPQTITFPNPGTKSESTTSFSSSATTDASGLFVTLESADPAICTVTNLTGQVPRITPLKAGTCTVTASSGETAIYDAAVSKTVSFLITGSGSSSSSSGGTTGNSLEVHTAGAESISTAGATLYGLITPAGNTMTYKFCWTRSSSAIKSGVITQVGSTNDQNNQVKCSTATNVGSAGPNVSVNEAVTRYIKDGSEKSFSDDRNYYFQVIGYVGSKPYYGEVMSFNIPKSSADIVRSKTNTVSTSTETTANLSGSFASSKRATTQQTYCVTQDPKQIAINYNSLSFHNTSLANCKQLTSSTVIASSLPQDRTDSNTAYVLSGLSGGQWYYFQTRAYDSIMKKTAYGRIVAFQTSSAAPVSTTLPVSIFESTSAVLPGSVISNGESTTVTFEISQAANMSSLTSINATPAKVLGKNGVSVSAKTAALNLGTRYYYRVKAVRDADSAVHTGEVLSFVLGAPAVTTSSPTGLETDTVSTWKVNLNGFLKSQGFLATPSFCWGTTSTVNAEGVLQSCTDQSVSAIDSTTASTSFTQQLTGVSPNTTFYYQAKALNREYLSAQLWSYGEVKSFTTAFAPDAVTLDATNVGSTSATLNGTVTSIGDSATVSFCLSKGNERTPDDSSILLNCDFQLSIAENQTSQLAGSNQSGTKAVKDLAKTTTYYYQIAASNKMGSVVGEVKSFTTNAGGPTVTTSPSEWISNTSAKIYGSVLSNGSDTNSYFCLSTDSSTVAAINGTGDSMTVCNTYASPTGLLVLGSNTSSASQNYTATGLTTSTTYYYQLFGVNARGERSYGSVLSLRLDQPIVTTTSQVDSLTATSAVIRGTANKNSYGSAIQASFCLATAPDLTPVGVLASCDPTDMTFTTISTNVANNISESLVALDPGTTYYYQAYVALSSDTSTPIIGGRMYSFTTDSMVTFDANGGNGGPETQTSKVSTSLRLFNSLNLTPSDTSTAFVTWNTMPDGSGTDYADGATFNFEGNLNLFAIWSDPSSTFSVTYDLGGGSGTVPVQGNKSSGQRFNLLGSTGFSKSGFTFAGWNCGSTTYAALAPITMTGANMTCVAVWTPVATAEEPKKIEKKKLVLNWGNPSAINFGTPLSGRQLNASTDALSTCVYSPALGAVLAPGEYTLTVTCTPVDGTNYEPVSGTVKLTVNKVKGKPRIVWFNPSPITNPTPLSGTQLNAVASVAGNYEYEPAAGTVLAPGRHKLNVKFSPSNKDENEEMEANVTIDVLLAKSTTTTPTKPAETSTVTTAPALPAPTKPAQPADITTATAPALKPQMQTAGKSEVVTVKPNEDKTGIIVSSDNWSLQIKSTTQFVQGTVEDTSARVVIEKGNTVTTSGTGFKPFSQVDVYVFSEPTWLGAVMTDEFGNFTTTLPMPNALPEGDHTFQATGFTPEDTTRKAEIPITLVPAVVKNKPGSMRFEVYFAMNGVAISKAEKAKTDRMVKIAKSRIASGAKVTVEISGWVQPNPNPGNIKYLSTNRAKNVRDLLQALGLKGTYALKYPGLAKDNIPSARHASVVIKWSKSK